MKTIAIAQEHPEKVKDLRARLDRYQKAALKVERVRARPAGFQTPKRWGHSDSKKDR